MKMPCVKPGGWEVKAVTSEEYKPDPEWYPFAITKAGYHNYIWLRRQLLTFTDFDTEAGK